LRLDLSIRAEEESMLNRSSMVVLLLFKAGESEWCSFCYEVEFQRLVSWSSSKNLVAQVYEWVAGNLLVLDFYYTSKIYY
jgi:hypothetical protein